MISSIVFSELDISKLEATIILKSTL